MTLRKRVLSVMFLAGGCLVASVASFGADDPGPAPAWPEVTGTMRPWAYWWWMGSAVDRDNLVRELRRYRDAGLGGVHIIPIYGAKGYEDRSIAYLLPRWLEMLSVTITEARRLGLDVDMTLGTGWCFGGPEVSARDANARVVVRTLDVPAGQGLKERFDRDATQALVAFPVSGPPVDLTGRIGADGSVAWSAGAGRWRVYAVSQRPSGQKVKRAAPGGEGPMLNPFSEDAVRHYLDGFSRAFAGYDGPMPRAIYQDSYEYQGDWSPDLFTQFERRRGYRLQDHLPWLFGAGTDERTARVKHDYRETISDLMVEAVTPAWVAWGHGRKLLTRNEAHGSPANLLDLYAAADIPETEMFARDRDPLMAKLASSAAHVAGRRLVSSETGTWLAEHFTETLGEMKTLVDEFFVAGVNHVFYHGTCYSPDEAAWPGWLFYAATEMNPRNAFWRDVPALNAYVTRCQSLLQAGRPDEDLLLYWPIAEAWQDPRGLVRPLTIHDAGLVDRPIGRAARRLWDRGFTFDYVSDRHLAGARAARGGIALPGGSYRAVVVPACDVMPLATFEALVRLADGGATILFEDHLPRDVPGLGDLDRRRAAFRTLRDGLTLLDAEGGLQEARHGAGRLLVGILEAGLARAGVAREPLVDRDGVRFLRRRTETGHLYFIAHHGDVPIDGWVPLATAAASIVALDPMTGRVGRCAVHHGEGGQTQVDLQLQPGESILLRTSADGEGAGPSWPYQEPSGRPVPLTGTWQVTFLQGGPALPGPLQTPALKSWTELGDDEARRFAGTALYRLTFDAPAPAAGPWWLDLGTVCHSARVRLNGRDLGTRFAAPFRVAVDELKPTANVLEVEVTNLSANRIRDLDRRGVPWKTFHDINFVNIDYKPFDASDWPVRASGLLGPVTLTPVTTRRIP
jgi:hypothetical protein